MREIEVRGHRIELYDGIDEMPIVRYHQFTKMLLIGDGLGCDIEALRGKVNEARLLIRDGETKKADSELVSLWQTLTFIERAVDPKSIAYAALVKSIDGEEQADHTQAGLERVRARLDGWLTKTERDAELLSVKKKIQQEARYYFPENNKEDVEMVGLLERLARVKLDGMIEGRDVSGEVRRIEARMRKIRKEIDYTQFEKDNDVLFEQGCLSITEQLGKDAKSMTVMEYEAALKLLNERAKEIEKIRKKK